MKEHETTRRARAASEISFSESGEIIEKAKQGDPIAKQEVENLARAFKESGFIEEVTKMVESISAPLSGFAEDILHKYILTFNKLYETDFETLDEIEEYIKENKLELKNEREVSDIIETSVVSPHDYVRTLGALTDRVFENTITLRNGKQGKYKVKLFTPTQKNVNEVSVYASVNFDKVFQDLGDEAEIPDFTDDGRQVHDGIVSNYLAGNRIMTYLMIYKGFTGDENCKRLPDGIFEMISEALLSFRGWLKIQSNGSNKRTDKNYNEPILVFRQYEESESVIINGKTIKGGNGIIEVYELPVLYRFALDNGNEVDTRPIKLLDIPNINNTPENLRLKRYLYSRVIAMRNNYERNVLKQHKKMSVSRKILFESIFSHIGATGADRKRKYKIVLKIEKTLNYWKDFGLIAGYTKTKRKGSNEVDGIEIDFIKREEIEDRGNMKPQKRKATS